MCVRVRAFNKKIRNRHAKSRQSVRREAREIISRGRFQPSYADTIERERGLPFRRVAFACAVLAKRPTVRATFINVSPL